MTREELRLLDYIKAEIGEHRISPSAEEMRDHLGLAPLPAPRRNTHADSATGVAS